MPSKTTTPKVWLITGCSSGFGRRLVTSAIARGDRVVATARVVEDLKFAPSPNLHKLQLDVTDGFEAVKKRVDEAAKVWNGIDYLVNNAGIGLPGLLEEGGSALLEKQFKTNVFGTLDVTNAVIPHLRAQRSGTIVLIGSRSAWRTEVPGIGFYSASKAAVHVLGETLAVEMACYNVRVLIVEPGGFRTEGIHCQPYFNGNEIHENNELRNTSMKIFSTFAGAQTGDPDKAMETLVDVVRGEGKAKGKPWPLYLVLGGDCEAGIRSKCAKMDEHLDGWSDVIRGVSFDEL